MHKSRSSCALPNKSFGREAETVTFLCLLSSIFRLAVTFSLFLKSFVTPSLVSRLRF